MLSVDEYRRQILEGLHVLDPLELPLASALGGVLAVDVAAPWPLPSFDTATTDGYAVRSADLAAASTADPATLTVVDHVPAGFRATEVVESGAAIRVMAGAPVPEGADAVAPESQAAETQAAETQAEETQAEETQAEQVSFRAPIGAGEHIRRAAEDVVAGELVLRSGSVIGARQAGILAAVGCGLVFVHPRPRVAVISVGSELIEPGLPLRHGLVSDATSYLLVAACREAGADAYRVGPLADDEDAFLSAVEDQLHRCDLILTCGGLSEGAHHTVKAGLSRLGTVTFTEVALEQAASQGHGVVGDDEVPIIALPGHPVSSHLSFEAFVRPALRRLRGLTQEQRPSVRTTCAGTIASAAGQLSLAQARFLPDGSVVPTGVGQGTHAMGGLAVADALVVVPEPVTRIATGDTVTVLDLR